MGLANKDFYAILKVARTASNTEIRAAYLKRCKECHPDRNPNVDTTKMMQDVNEAKAVLLDPAKRANFDNNFNPFTTASNGQNNYSKYQRQETEYKKKERTEKNKLRYEGLKKRLRIFEDKDKFLFDSYKSKIATLSTDDLLYTCYKWTTFATEYIDMIVFDLHEHRNYDLDTIYSKIKEPMVGSGSYASESKKEQTSWWASWALWVAISMLIKALTSKH